MNGYVNQLLLGDSLKLMQKIPDKSVDLIFADPPYFLQLKKTLTRPDATEVKREKDDWDKFEDFSAYDQFTKAWLSEAFRVLKETGSLWVIGSYHNIFRVGYHLQNQGFWIANDIIWRKTNPMPNFHGQRFTNAHETLIWCVKNPKAKHTFHYESLKVFNDGLQMRSDWCLPVCHGKERVKKQGKTLHPTQKPEALLYRILIATTNPKDVVLDPFMGTGTTCVVAKKLGRCWIGIEKEVDYFSFAKKRLEQTQPFGEDTLNPIPKDLPNQVRFGDLVSGGIIAPGTFLYSKDGRHKAMVMVDGSLKYGQKQASIHQIAARIKKSPSCNGWLFWHFKQDRILKPIDILREYATIPVCINKGDQNE